MQQLQTYWYKPKNQTKGQPEVEFELRPINQRTLNEMFADWRGNKTGPDGALSAARYAVVNWRGLPKEFSTTALLDLFDGEASSVDASLWLFSIAGECFRRATLKATDAKNS